jgi:tetratricopeptide (TPR) repeat protein
VEQQTILRRYTLGGVFGNATGQVMLNPIAMRIERLLVTMMTASVPTTPELDALFKLLHEASDPGDRSDAEQRIWAIWSGHEDADAAHAMRNAIAALDSGDLTAADRELTMMVERWPNWAEAWNRRATLRFVEERDAESLDDIERTLELEPRHFGALSGFGQICFRAHDISSALLAFEHAVAVNPNMNSIRQAAEVLRKHDLRTIH